MNNSVFLWSVDNSFAFDFLFQFQTQEKKGTMSSSSLRISVDSDGRVVLGEEVVEKLSVLR
jgi:hypothetical protein